MHPRAARRLGELVTAPEARRLLRGRPRRASEAGAFLTGDAAGGVDPVLGCGVAIALATGVAAAHAARDVVHSGSGAPERRYARRVRAETSLRGGVARALLFLAAHPAVQDAVAGALALWPGGARRLALAVGGA
jgi:flavin-dependent dehydrogenase